MDSSNNQYFNPERSDEDPYPFHHIAPLTTIIDESSKTPPKPVTASVKLLVSGYIRQIQFLLKKDDLIPKDIDDLCLLFYHVKTIKMLWKIYKSPYSSQEEDNDSIRQFGILNMDNKSCLNIDLKKSRQFADKKHFHPLVYIPTVSSPKLTNNEILNGIFTFEVEQFDDYWSLPSNPVTFKSYPSLILFDEYQETNNEITTKYEYKSDKALQHEPPQILYIENKNMILYEWNGSFYALHLNHIDDINDLSNFKEVLQNNVKFKLNSMQRHKSKSSKKRSRRIVHGRSHSYYEYLNMLYLEDTVSIFAIHSRHASISTCKDWARGRPKETKCGIFNIDNGNWTDIESFKYLKGPVNDAFSCKLCTNYDNDIIYLYNESNVNYTSLYDMNKNEWRTVSTDVNYNYGMYLYSFWLQDQSLYGISSCSKDNKGSKDYKYQLNRLDLRDDKRKWIKNGFDFAGLDKDKSYSLY